MSVCRFVHVCACLSGYFCIDWLPRDNICISTCSSSALRLYFTFVLIWDGRGVEKGWVGIEEGMGVGLQWDWEWVEEGLKRDWQGGWGRIGVVLETGWQGIEEGLRGNWSGVHVPLLFPSTFPVCFTDYHCIFLPVFSDFVALLRLQTVSCCSPCCGCQFFVYPTPLSTRRPLTTSYSYALHLHSTLLEALQKILFQSAYAVRLCCVCSVCV